MSIPIIPAIALIAGILILIKADILNWVVALFLIGFGLLGLAPLAGVDVAPIEAFLFGLADKAEQIQ